MDNGGRWLLIVGIAGGTTSYTVEVGHRYPIAYEVDCTSQQLKVSFSGSGSSTWDGTFEEIGIEFAAASSRGDSDGGPRGTALGDVSSTATATTTATPTARPDTAALTVNGPCDKHSKEFFQDGIHDGCIGVACWYEFDKHGETWKGHWDAELGVYGAYGIL